MAILYPHTYLIIMDTGEVCYLDSLTADVLNIWDCTIIDLLSSAYYDSVQKQWFPVKNFHAYIAAVTLHEIGERLN